MMRPASPRAPLPRRALRALPRHALRVVAGLAGALLLAAAVRRIDGAALAAALRRLDVGLWMLALVAVVGWKLGAKALRSQVLLSAACARDGREPPRFGETARLLLASHAAGQIVWSPLGFTVRTIGLVRAGWPLAAVARVQVGERIAEAIALSTMAGLTAALAEWPRCGGGGASDGRGAAPAMLAAAVVVVAAVALLIVAIARGKGRMPAGLRARAQRWSGWLAPLARASLWAILSSVGDLVVLLLAASSVGVSVDLATALVVFVAVNGATAVPLVPAQVGVMEAAIVVGLGTAGVGTEAGLAVAVAYRAAHVVPLALAGGPGVIGIWRVRRAERQRQEAGAAEIAG